MYDVLSTAIVIPRQASRAVRKTWRAIRNPAGWYDEVDEVYGRTTTVDGTASAASAATGVIAGGGAGPAS